MVPTSHTAPAPARRTVLVTKLTYDNLQPFDSGADSPAPCRMTAEKVDSSKKDFQLLGSATLYMGYYMGLKVAIPDYGSRCKSKGTATS